MGIVNRIIGSPQDRFAREALEAVRRTGVAEAWYAPEDFAIGYRRQPGDRSGWVYLHNIFQACKGASRAEQRERIAALVDSVVNAPGLPQTWEEARSHLRPVLRSALFGLGAPPEADPLLSRPALPFLAEFVVVDQPTSMAYVTGEQVRNWDVPPDEVFAAARANLAEISGPDDTNPHGGPAVLRYIDSGDGYYTSRLLLSGWLAGLTDHVSGRPVAFVPNRNTMIVTADHPDSLAKLFELVETEYSESVRSISPQAYTIGRDGAIVPYPTPPGHPLTGSVRRADAILAAGEYGAQAEWLNREHERGGLDIFVARLSVVGRPDGSIITVSSWAEGVDTLLPRADVVAFTSERGQPWFVSWPIVAEEVSDLVAEPDLAPARYRVTAWPEPEVLERLQARATQP